jgi:hypothetical protein
MPDPIEHASAPAAATLLDHRRPGRVDAVSPALLPLLRGTALPEEVAWQEEVPQSRDAIEGYDPNADQLSAAKGILLALIVLLPFWAFAGFMAWKIIRFAVVR